MKGQIEDERRATMMNEEQILKKFNNLNREREELIQKLQNRDE